MIVPPPISITCLTFSRTRANLLGSPMFSGGGREPVTENGSGMRKAKPVLTDTEDMKRKSEYSKDAHASRLGIRVRFWILQSINHLKMVTGSAPGSPCRLGRGSLCSVTDSEDEYWCSKTQLSQGKDKVEVAALLSGWDVTFQPHQATL